MDLICLKEYQLIFIIVGCLVGGFLWFVLGEYLVKKDKELREKEIKRIIEVYKNEGK